MLLSLALMLDDGLISACVVTGKLTVNGKVKIVAVQQREKV